MNPDLFRLFLTKVHAQFNFGPLCAYLSVNYLDRFLAVYEFPVSLLFIFIMVYDSTPSYLILLEIFKTSIQCSLIIPNINAILHMLFNEQKDKAWMMQLLSVACLSLASKMEETEVPLILDLQVKLVFIIKILTFFVL